jgi:hypothetical protein
MGQADDSDIGGQLKECSVVSKSASATGLGQLGGPLLGDVGNTDDAYIGAEQSECLGVLLGNLTSPNDSNCQSRTISSSGRWHLAFL